MNRKSGCAICGTVIPYPFKCNFCGGTFCAEHRLPEAHACLFLSDVRSGTLREKPGDIVVKTDLSTIESESSPSDEKLPRDEIRPSMSAREPKGRARIVVALCILLITVPLIAGYFSYDFGYGFGYEFGYNGGNSTGYSLGYDSGNSSGYASGNLSGYGTGYNFGYTKGLNDGAGSGFTIRNPTYQEMQSFIATDQTDQNRYIIMYPPYVCWNFAGDVKNNAFKAGFRCGFVYVSFPDSAHAIVCFQTIDQGLVFIEPQDDSIMSLVIGEHYWDRSKYIIIYDDTVVRYGIIW